MRNKLLKNLIGIIMFIFIIIIFRFITFKLEDSFVYLLVNSGALRNLVGRFPFILSVAVPFLSSHIITAFICSLMLNLVIFSRKYLIIIFSILMFGSYPLIIIYFYKFSLLNLLFVLMIFAIFVSLSSFFGAFTGYHLRQKLGIISNKK